MTSEASVRFTANLPTEEILTLPHKDRVDGVVQGSRPLSYAGALIEDFSLEFSAGRVVKATARKGEEALQALLGTDSGAARLGEVALVPHNSPISQAGVVFYNLLLDENAASHLAPGNAYRFTLEGGRALSDEAFAAAGGNTSIAHVDFMIGSGEMDVEGLLPDGTSEPLMRAGAWAFDG